MAKYNDIMAKISVTPQMRERVLANVMLSKDRENLQYKKKSLRRIQSLRWLPGVVAACLILIVGIRFYQPQSLTDDQDSMMEVGQGGAGVEDYSSITELENAVGFSISEIPAEEIPFEVREVLYTNVFGLPRITYYGTKEERLVFSKAVDDGSDISGNYNEFETVKEVQIEDCTVTLKGNDGLFNLAVWTYADYAYSLDFEPGLQEEQIENIIKIMSTK